MFTIQKKLNRLKKTKTKKRKVQPTSKLIATKLVNHRTG